MKAIFKREFKNYFVSPAGYIFAGVFTALSAMFFVRGVLLTQKADISAVFSNINIVYLFLCSMLTMRLLAEEKAKKTDLLLMSAPVTSTQIVLGKYFAALAVFGVTLIISLVFPAVILVFSQASPGEIISSYIGFILLWASFISIGIFISALTESQMIAGVFTFAVLLIIYFMSWFSANISNSLVLKLMSIFSLLERYSSFQSGIINMQSIMYYIGFVIVFLRLTIHVIDRKRYC